MRLSESLHKLLAKGIGILLLVLETSSASAAAPSSIGLASGILVASSALGSSFVPGVGALSVDGVEELIVLAIVLHLGQGLSRSLPHLSEGVVLVAVVIIFVSSLSSAITLASPVSLALALTESAISPSATSTSTTESSTATASTTVGSRLKGRVGQVVIEERVGRFFFITFLTLLSLSVFGLFRLGLLFLFLQFVTFEVKSTAILFLDSRVRLGFELSLHTFLSPVVLSVAMVAVSTVVLLGSIALVVTLVTIGGAPTIVVPLLFLRLSVLLGSSIVVALLLFRLGVCGSAIVVPLLLLRLRVRGPSVVVALLPLRLGVRGSSVIVALLPLGLGVVRSAIVVSLPPLRLGVVVPGSLLSGIISSVVPVVVPHLLCRVPPDGLGVAIILISNISCFAHLVALAPVVLILMSRAGKKAALLLRGLGTLGFLGRNNCGIDTG